MPQALGGGHGLIGAIQTNQYTLMVLVLLVLVKFGLTMTSYGSGAPGGIFMPLLVIGALTGGVFSQLTIKIGHIDPSFGNNFVVFAMAAYFTAIVKAPVTGSILITEMTGSFEHLPALITVSMTAYIIADLLKSKPVYDTLLNRVLSKRREEHPDNEAMSSNTLLEVVVFMGSQLERKMIRDVSWPQHCLLVNVKRGEEQLIPRGDTQLMAGDYLYILTDEKYVSKTKPVLLQMAGYEHSVP